MPDQITTCLDCHQQFPFTSDEQEFYKQKGLEPPKYCMICRGKYQAKQKDLNKYGKKL